MSTNLLDVVSGLRKLTRHTPLKLAQNAVNSISLTDETIVVNVDMRLTATYTEQ